MEGVLSRAKKEFQFGNRSRIFSRRYNSHTSRFGGGCEAVPRDGFCVSGATSIEKIRVFVYIDGFNLYYRALRRTRYRWLNVEQMCRLLLNECDEIVQVRFYTAPVWSRGDDPEKPKRQRTYLRALRTLPRLSIHYGKFRSHTVRMPLVPKPDGVIRYVEVIKTEEKSSDVNLASHLLHDAHLNRYDMAVVVSNDSDLLEPMRLVRKELRKGVGLLVPGPHPSRDLARYANFMKRIRENVLRLSQFPVFMTDEHGTFRKPIGW